MAIKPEVLLSDYIGVKIHFNEELFDFSNYGNKISKINIDSLNKRKDKAIFISFARKFKNRKSELDYLISVFLKDKNTWIGDLFDEDKLEYHFERMKRCNALMYFFKNDIEKIEDYLLENKLDFLQILTCTNQKPIISKLKLELETLVILNKVFGYANKYQTEDHLWEETRFKIKKYGSLLNIDEFKPIIKNEVNKLLAAFSRNDTFNGTLQEK